MKINKYPNMLRGFIFGSILSISQINLSFGLPLSLVGLLVTAPRFTFKKEYLDLFLLLLFQIIWMSSVYFIYKASNALYLFKYLSVFVILMPMLFIDYDESYMKGISLSILALLSVDFLFNMSSIVFGVDPLGRTPDIRPGDIIPRLGGIFGHSFFSVNISIIGIFCGLLLKSRFIFIISIINLMVNGTFRSWLSILLFVLAYILIRAALKFRNLLVCLIIFVSFVFAITIYTAFEYDSGGNALRVFAWSSSIDQIFKNPLFGKQKFLTGVFEGVNQYVITDYGIAESQYLEIGLHFGIIPMIIYILILFKILLNSCKYNLLIKRRWTFRETIALASVVIFADTFYGSIFGSVLTTFFFGILLVSNPKANFKNNESLKYRN